MLDYSVIAYIYVGKKPDLRLHAFSASMHCWTWGSVAKKVNKFCLLEYT